MKSIRGSYYARWLVPFLVTLTMSINAWAQNPSTKHLGDKHQPYFDSLKKMNYNRVFPLLGDRVYKRGFDIPFPFGIMINNFYGVQDIIIDNVNIGIKSSGGSLGPANVDKIVQFNNVNSKLFNVNLRADMYIFPFFNVYGLVSYIPYARTHVELTKPLQLTAEPKQNGWAYGVGAMVAFGIGPVWMQADYNMTWADMELLETKVFTQITGIRVGHAFLFNNNPEKNISVWLGAMGIFINNNTIGEVKLSELFPDMSQQQVDQARANYNSEPTLTSLQKQIMDKITQKLSDRIGGINVDDASITYQLDKAIASNWAGLAGIQYQFNKRWQLRAESNFISSDRFSVLLSINYRFLGFKKKTPAN